MEIYVELMMAKKNNGLVYENLYLTDYILINKLIATSK